MWVEDAEDVGGGWRGCGGCGRMEDVGGGCGEDVEEMAQGSQVSQRVPESAACSMPYVACSMMPSEAKGLPENPCDSQRGAERVRRKNDEVRIVPFPAYLRPHARFLKLTRLRGTGGVAGGLGFVQAQESF